MTKKETEKRKLGVWLIGAYGAVATCVVAGIEGIKKGLVSKAGLVTELPQFADIDLVALDELVFGGCDVRRDSLVDAAYRLHKTSNLIGRDVLDAIKPELEKIDARIVGGVTINCGQAVEEFAESSTLHNGVPLVAMIAEIQEALAAFKQANDLDEVVVVNLASAEAFSRRMAEHDDIGALAACLSNDDKEKFSSGIIYAYAAIDAGHPYLNFAASISEEIPAITQLACERGVAHMGKDGKTGETLVKTVLAPMFAARNLKVMSWISHNILGNRDGEVLANPESAREKLRNKGEVLSNILGDDEVDSQVRIDYVKSLDDWKTAWNLIHFNGFLDTKMIMQFIWQGCDSALAAPLVLDLARLLDHAQHAGLSGPQRHLACFFKSPTAVDEQAFAQQFEMLMDYVGSYRTQER